MLRVNFSYKVNEFLLKLREKLIDIEKIDIQQVNDAFERVLKGDVKYRFVIDLKSLNP